ncbi:MAG TPA: dephospho-CoA kinase [archaeon]|nr:dephospho-CoA kinase [archaeon]
MLVAITGNFCSGKSTLIAAFSKLGYETFEADKFVDMLYQKDFVMQLLGKEFGEYVVSQRKVNKRALADIVFSDFKKLQKLNRLIHPIIKEEIKKIDHEGKMVFCEMPLLFEAQMDDLFDKIILVKCSERSALARAAGRGYSEEEFKRRIHYQWDDQKKAQFADFIVDSEQSVQELEAAAQRITKELL